MSTQWLAKGGVGSRRVAEGTTAPSTGLCLPASALLRAVQRDRKRMENYVQNRKCPLGGGHAVGTLVREARERAIYPRFPRSSPSSALGYGSRNAQTAQTRPPPHIKTSDHPHETHSGLTCQLHSSSATFPGCCPPMALLYRLSASFLGAWLLSACSEPRQVITATGMSQGSPQGRVFGCRGNTSVVTISPLSEGNKAVD